MRTRFTPVDDTPVDFRLHLQCQAILTQCFAAKELVRVTEQGNVCGRWQSGAGRSVARFNRAESVNLWQCGSDNHDPLLTAGFDRND